MDLPSDKGKSRRQQFEFTAKTYGLKNEELNPENEVVFPKVYNRVLEAFSVLSQTRVERNTINIVEIKCYMELYRVNLCPSEIQALQLLDGLFLKYLRKYELEG